MSARDDSHGGRRERETITFGGVGLHSAGRCDECQRDSLAGRRKAKVKKGPLRGITGMVCNACLALREKAAA
jgi:hypothetical protein